MKTLWLIFVPLLLAAQEPQWREGEINGRRIRYEVVDGEAMLGDIVLGPAAAFESETASKKTGRGSSVVVGEYRRWPDGVIPYVIDEDVPDKAARVEKAIQVWNEKTPIKLVVRTTEMDYVQFRRRNGFACSSSVGRTGSRQYINLPDSCSTGSIVHEIGHAVGLFHTQSRQDRDIFLKVNLAGVSKDSTHNFEQALQGYGEDRGSYPFDSIMHYSEAAFAQPGEVAIQTIPEGIPIGQRTTLTAGDIDLVYRLYGQAPRRTTISTNPEGLRVVVDGQTIYAPATFDWVPGSTHTLRVDDQMEGANRMTFGRWSNFGGREQVIQAAADVTVFTAHFRRLLPFPTFTFPNIGGKIEIQPERENGYYPVGTVVHLKAVPTDGYQFTNWSGFGFFSQHGSANPVRIPVVSEEIEYEASFSRQPLTTINSTPPGLRVEVDGRAVTTPQRYTWTAGSSHTIKVTTPKQTLNNGVSQHNFGRWSTGDGETQTIVASAEGATVTAQFDTRYRVAAGAYPSSGGTVTVRPALEEGYAPGGSTVQFDLVPRNGFALEGWSGDASGAASSVQVLVDRELAATALLALPRTITFSGIVNAASQQPGEIAPGELVTFYGLGIGPEQPKTLALDAQGKVAVSLQNTRVLFDGIPAPLIYVSANQINCVVPYGVSGQATVRVETNGQLTNSLSLVVMPAAPAFFTYNSSGLGGGAFLNENGSVNTKENPAVRGSVAVLYATGIGALAPGAQDGEVTRGAGKAVLPLKVWIADREAVVEYAGPAPGLVSGVAQLNVRVPVDIEPGVVPVVLQAGEFKSQRTVSLAVR